MGLDAAQVAALLHTAATAGDTDAQGKAFEALAVYLFQSVEGCIVAHDVTNVFGTEQIDVAVGNGRHPNGLTLLPSVILVECKDWAQPVDSKTVGYFINILTNRSVEVGILIAANGITGNKEELTHAHALGIPALGRGIKLLVVTTDDIRSLTCSADFVELLHQRYLRAFASGSLGMP